MPVIDLLEKLPDSSRLFQELTGLRDDTLGSPAALKEERTEALDESKALPLPGTNLEAGASIRLALLNQADDKDDAKVFGPSPAPAPEFPVLAPGGNQAWLRYALSVEASLSGTVPLASFLALDLGASGKASYTAYKPHSTATTLYTALRADLRSFRPLLFDLDSLPEAKLGEVHSFEREGDLSVELKVNLASFFPAALRAFKLSLPSPVGASKPALSVAGSLGADISLGAAISDSFAIYLARTGPDAYRVQVKRARSRGVNAGMKIGAEVTLQTANLKSVLEGLPAVQEFEAQILTKVLDGVSAEEVAQLRTHLLSGQNLPLPAQLQSIANKAYASLDKYLAKTVTRTLADLLGEIDDVRKAIREALEKALKTEISFSLGLSWSRVHTHETLLQATLTSSEIATHGRDLLLGRFESLRTLLLTRPRHTEEKPVFLDTKILTEATTLSFGFELGSFALKTTRKRQTSRTEITDLHGRVKPSYAIDFTDTEGLGFERNSSRAHLVSTLPDFDDPETIQARHFEHTLQLSLAYDDPKTWVSDLDILEYLDTAALWGGLETDPAVLRSHLQEIRAWHRGVGGVLSLRLSLTAEPEALALLWTEKIAQDDLARALAAAVGPGDPGESKHAALASIAGRIALLEPVWKDVLSLPSNNYRHGRDRWDFAADVGRIARQHLLASAAPGARDLADLQQTNFFAGTHGPHRKPAQYPRPQGHDLGTLVFALRLAKTNWLTHLTWLREAGHELVHSESFEHEKTIRDALTDFAPLVAHPFYARAYGYALRQIKTSPASPAPQLKVVLSAEAGKSKRSTLAIA